MGNTKKLYPGDRVQVRSYEEIAATLDADGCLDHIPFMPEMMPLCGKHLVVRHRLTKTCVEGYGARLLARTVTLEGAYCDGSSHEGCQRSCPLLWKEAWLRPLEPRATAEDHGEVASPGGAARLRTRRDDRHFFCQSTELGRATTYLFPVSFKRCTAEFRAGNVGPRKAFEFLWLPFVVKLKTKLLGKAAVQPVGNGSSTPAEALGLRAGEFVEVKSVREISLTLDQRGRNRGLEFTPSMLPFCGRKLRVRSRVERMILETTGEMREIGNTVILEGVTCDGHTILGGCSRHVFHLWREAWLRRLPDRPGRADVVEQSLSTKADSPAVPTRERDNRSPRES
jgi:hypothetical protein